MDELLKELQALIDKYADGTPEGVTEEEAARVEELFHKENKELEITVIDGGQPVYYYLVSVE